MMEFLVLIILPLALGFWAQHHVGSTFRRWAQVPTQSGLTGEQVARTILDRNGLHDVPVESVPGDLTDHYDPRARAVRLSPVVYGGNSVASVSVAAHEVGHAIQHARRYAPMSVRSALFPAAAFGGSSWQILFVIGVVLFFMNLGGLGLWVIAAGLALYSFAVLFHVVTLPVEFNASSRARQQLVELGAIAPDEQAGAGKVLNAAALTYVAGALASIAALLYYVHMFFGRNE